MSAEAEVGAASPTAAPIDTPAAKEPSTANRSGWGWIVLGVIIVLGLGYATRYLDKNFAAWVAGTGFARIAKSIEYPVWAIAIGLLTLTGLRHRAAQHFAPSSSSRPLVLFGVSINIV